ncbi:MAG: regulatory protein RecX [Candidatus Nanopelagicales bacterium]
MSRSRRASADGPTPGSAADAVPDADPYEVARTIALRQLTLAPRTRAQLASALARKGVEEQVALDVLDRLEDVRLVDDAAYAEAWVRSRHAGRGLARRALGHELRQRGVAEPLVVEALEGVTTEDEAAAARALVDRKLPGTRQLGVETRIRRLVGMLARKGYSGGLAMRVVREALADERELSLHETQVLDGLDVDLSDAARVGE